MWPQFRFTFWFNLTALFWLLFFAFLAINELQINNDSFLSIAVTQTPAANEKLASQSTSFRYRSHYPNFGAISLRTRNTRNFTGQLQIAIWDDKHLVAKNEYDIFSLPPYFWYQFGLPRQSESKTHDYQIVISSSEAPINDILQVNTSNDRIIYKHIYTKGELMNHPGKLFVFLWQKYYEIARRLLPWSLSIILVTSLVGAILAQLGQSGRLMTAWQQFRINPRFNEVSYAFWFISALVVVLVPLWPILQSGYFFDDLANSQTLGRAYFLGLNIHQYAWRMITTVTTEHGRLHPGMFLYHYYALFPTLWQYKVSILILNVTAISIWSMTMATLYRNRHIGWLAMWVSAVVLQMRQYHDSVTSYNGLLPILFILFSLAFFSYLRFLHSGRTRWYVSSLLLYLLMLLNFYEFTYVLFPLFIMVDYQQRRHVLKALITTGPFVFLSGSGIFLSILIPIITPGNYAGTTVSLQFWPLLTTLAKQLVAAIPLSNAVLLRYFNLHLSSAQIVGGLFFGLTFLTVLYTLRSPAPARSSPSYYLLGVLLVLLPAIPIALSQRYQQELIWGEGYLPVYFQYYGMILIMLQMIWDLLYITRPRTNILRGKMGLMTVILTLLWVLNATGNQYIVQRTNAYWKYPMEFNRTALSRGIVNTIPENTTVYFEKPGNWMTKEFFWQATNRQYQLSLINDSQNLGVKHNWIPFYHYHVIGDGIGVAAVASDVTLSPTNTQSWLCASEVILFTEIKDESTKKISYHWCDSPQGKRVVRSAQPGLYTIQFTQPIAINTILIHD